MSSVEEVDAKAGEANQPDGLAGWLLLVGLGVVISPIRLVVTMMPVYNDLFVNGGWEAVSTPDGPHYSPGLMSFLGFEIIFNIAVVIASIYLIYLFFAKHRRFPKLYIGLIIVSLVMIPLDAYFASILLPDEPMWDPQTVKEFMRTLLVGGIWIPYMLVSKRVKATFRDRHEQQEIEKSETTSDEI